MTTPGIGRRSSIGRPTHLTGAYRTDRHMGESGKFSDVQEGDVVISDAIHDFPERIAGGTDRQTDASHRASAHPVSFLIIWNTASISPDGSRHAMHRFCIVSLAFHLFDERQVPVQPVILQLSERSRPVAQQGKRTRGNRSKPVTETLDPAGWRSWLPLDTQDATIRRVSPDLDSDGSLPINHAVCSLNMSRPS